MVAVLSRNGFGGKSRIRLPKNTAKSAASKPEPAALSAPQPRSEAGSRCGNEGAASSGTTDNAVASRS